MIAGQCLAKEIVTILKALGKIVHVNYHTECVSGFSQEKEKRKMTQGAEGQKIKCL